MQKYSIRTSLCGKKLKNGTRTIRMRVSWNGIRCDQWLPISVDPDYWIPEKERVKNTYHADRLSGSTINNIIDSYRKGIGDVFYECDYFSRIPTVQEIRNRFSAIRQGRDNTVTPNKRLFATCVDDFVHYNSILNHWAPSSIKRFSCVKSNLEKFRRGIRLCDMNKHLLMEYTEFLYRQGKRNSTVQKTLQQIKWVLRWCKNEGWIENDDFEKFRPRFKGVDSHSREVIYLSWGEMMRLYYYNFEAQEQLAQTRDLLLFCCFTGLRYSDARDLSWSNIYDNKIHVVTQKTQDALVIELNSWSAAILAKYVNPLFVNNNTAIQQELFRARQEAGEVTEAEMKSLLSRCASVPKGGKIGWGSSLQSMNKKIRKMAEAAGLRASTKQVVYVRSERIEKEYPKYKLLTSHCGRRSFVVNALRLGIPVEVIMQWTGHSDYKSMRPYIAVVDASRQECMNRFNFD